MEKFEIQQHLLYSWLWNNEDKNKEYIEINNNFTSYNQNQLAQIRSKITNNFLPANVRKWNLVSRIRGRFEKKYKRFLSNKFQVDFVSNLSKIEDKTSMVPTTSTSASDSTDLSSKKKGRPCVSYEESSERNKRKRISEIRSTFCQEELHRAAGHGRDKRALVPIKKNKDNEEDERFSDTVLAMYMDLDLTKSKYNTLRSYSGKLFGDKSYPPYPKVLSAKTRCYPEDIRVTDNGASVELQSLLDHTVRRLISSIAPEVLGSLQDKLLILYSKWGMDGASSQQVLQQNRAKDTAKETTSSKVINTDEGASMSNDIDEHQNTSDQSVFIISFVPLELRFENKIIWVNDRPSSIRFCRPIKFDFITENAINSLNEYNYYTEKIGSLHPTHVAVNNISFSVIHDLQCTMIDGKTCNVITNQKSSNSCNICGARPTQMNKLDIISTLPRKKEFYTLGLSTLHCKIRFMECLLHIAYNMDFKESSARGDENKNAKQNRKKFIQYSLKEALGINVDMVKQGAGNTNTGNTARRFFAKPQIVAKICQLDERLVTRFGIILQVLASGHEIDAVKFHQYALETAQLYVDLYSWYFMPPTVHKVLMHGGDIIASSFLPIGRYSEEAQEANNKVFRHARSHSSRWSSRRNNNEDVIHYLLVSSDPLISSFRLKIDKQDNELSDNAKKLLKL